MCLRSLLVFGENSDLGGIVDLGRQEFICILEARPALWEMTIWRPCTTFFCSLTFYLLLTYLLWVHKYHMAKAMLSMYLK